MVDDIQRSHQGVEVCGLRTGMQRNNPDIDLADAGDDRDWDGSMDQAAVTAGLGADCNHLQRCCAGNTFSLLGLPDVRDSKQNHASEVLEVRRKARGDVQRLLRWVHARPDRAVDLCHIGRNALP